MGMVLAFIAYLQIQIFVHLMKVQHFLSFSSVKVRPVSLVRLLGACLLERAAYVLMLRVDENHWGKNSVYMWEV